MMILSKPTATGVRLVSLVALLSLTGCVWVEDTQDLQAFVREKQATSGGPIEPLPEFKPYESFVYQGASLRNPFEPLVAVSEQSQNIQTTNLKPDLDRPKSYLESFSIDQLQMVGTITQPGADQLWALVQDAKGEVHRVREGDFMGLDYGEVTAVSEQFIELKEIVSNGRGGWMNRPRTMVLPEQVAEQ